MSREPLFTAQPRLPRVDVHEDVPGDSGHPASLTEHIRRFLLTDGEALFTAKDRQAEHARKTAEAEAAAQEQGR